MRIAICLSGYFRLYRDIQLNFRRNVLEPCRARGEVDLFVSSWNQLNSTYSFSHKQGDGVPPQCGMLDEADILRAYPAKDSVFESFSSLSDSFHIHRYDSSVDLGTLHPNIHENGVLFGLAMFYRRWMCNEMKKKSEEKIGVKYNLVIQMRPDLFFLRPLDIDHVDPAKLSSRTLYNDHMLISSSENIDRISDVHPQIARIMHQYKMEKPLWFEPYCPEYFLEHLFKELGFDKTNRVELGEDLTTLYPRKNFGATLYYILTKYGRLAEWNTVVDYPLTQPN